MSALTCLTQKIPESSGFEPAATSAAPADASTVGAAESLRGLFGRALPLTGWCSGGGIRYTSRWRHPGLRGQLASLREHVIAVTYSGTATVIMECAGRRQTGQLRHGAVTLLPAGTHGAVHFAGERECSQVLIPAHALEQHAATTGQPAGDLQLRLAVADPVLFRLVEMLAATHYGSQPDHGFREQCTNLICTHLLNRYCEGQIPEEITSPGLANWQLRRIEEFMRMRLHAPLSLQDIAAQVDLSRHYLCTAFRRSTGLAPYEYLTGLRIDRAKELLAGTESAIGDIAVAVGYGTPSAFTACFRRFTGTTPRAYRDRVRDEGVSPPAPLARREAERVAEELRLSDATPRAESV